MELALALSLRVYHIVPDSVLMEIIRHRKRLYGHYRRPYAERSSGRGEPVVFEINGQPPVRMRGIFLDLQLNFSGGRLVTFGPPKSLSPYQAVSVYADRDLAARTQLPIALSVLSERVVALSLSSTCDLSAFRSPPNGPERRATKRVAPRFTQWKK